MEGCDLCWHLTIRRHNRYHVIDEHYLFEDMNSEKSYFFANQIAPHQLFHIITHVPRWQMYQLGWREGRFGYTFRFNFDVGVYPAKGIGHTPTNRVKIVCASEECPSCGREAPTDIITMFTWDKY